MAQADPQTLLQYWFSPQVKPLWFAATAEFDQEFEKSFSTYYTAACRGELNDWKNTAQGSLALVLLFDQYPLNVFRGQKQCFATEQQARDIANLAIEQGLDQQLTEEQKVFLYMPLMHSESLQDQDRSVELCQTAGLTNLEYAKHHREIIRRFGRFPHRNAILGRHSTPEELDYLNSDQAFNG